MARYEPAERATAATRARYGRIAPLYDALEALPELTYRSWRAWFWGQVVKELPPGGDLLEVGVGTGKNLPYWPQAAQVTAIDLAPGMVRRARKRAQKLGLDAQVLEGDAQELAFPDNSFDLAAATFVFCSVPDPVRGLKELMRVVRPGGSVYLMEHVRSEDPLIGTLMDLLNPVVVRLMGPNINRDTVGNVIQAGLDLLRVDDIGRGGIFKIIHARKPLASEGDRFQV